jgi:hypothetical protein
MCQIDIDTSTISGFADDFLGEDNVLDNSEVEKIRESVQSDYDCDCVEKFIEIKIEQCLELRNNKEY